VFAGICCLLLLARRLFDQAGELAMVVFEETEDAAGLGIVGILLGIVEGGRGKVMLLPRGRDAVGASRGRGSAGVIMSLDKMCRLHGGGSSEV